MTEIRELVPEHVELVVCDLRTPLVDLRVDIRRGIEHRRRRSRLAPDADEVVEDAFLGQLLDEHGAVATAGEPGAHDRNAEPLEGSGDVDPFAAGAEEPAARPMPVAELEVGHEQRPVDGGVERNGDDHQKGERLPSMSRAS